MDGAPRRVVSLVPSLSEALEVTAPGVLVGATHWCTYPQRLRTDEVPRVGGPKNPDVDAVCALQPDLVVVNREENRAEDVAALRAAGLTVWMTDIADVPGALRSLRALTDLFDGGPPAWWRDACAVWRRPAPVRAGGVRAVVPIWRRPWMALGSATYAGDVLARLGVVNVLAAHAERYPRVDLSEVLASERPDLVVLPDEPYPFSLADGPECCGATPVACVDGRVLTWYGPAMVAAPEILGRQIADAWPKS